MAVLALAVFLSPGGVSDLTDFLLLSNRFFGTFSLLIAAVSVATPGGELVYTANNTSNALAFTPSLLGCSFSRQRLSSR